MLTTYIVTTYLGLFCWYLTSSVVILIPLLFSHPQLIVEPRRRQLLTHWLLYESVHRQMEAFREGFESVFPLENLGMFFPEEIDSLFCGSQVSRGVVSVCLSVSGPVWWWCTPF